MQVQLYNSEDGDWTDLFVNGQKVFGGHGLSADRLLDILIAHGAPITRLSDQTFTEADMETQVNGAWLGEAMG